MSVSYFAGLVDLQCSGRLGVDGGAEPPGGQVENMSRQSLLSLVVILIAAACRPSTVAAQDRLAAVVTKAKLTKQDVAQIEAEVPDRVKKLFDAGANEKERARARERLLATVKTAGVTKAGLDAYAEACASRLEPLTTSDLFETGFDAVTVLAEMDNPNTAGAFATALKSKHAAVRYRAARGIKLLHGGLKDDAERCKVAVRALGDAGAGERDPLVLGAIYSALDFYADAPDFQFGADCAGAVAALLAGRAKAAQAGGFDPLVDGQGLALAAASYVSATDAVKTRLVQYSAALLSSAVEVYSDSQTADEYLPTLAGAIKKMEDSVHAMIRASKKSPPEPTISSELSSKAAPAKKQEAAKAALKELMTVLKGDPWNLP